MDTNRGINLSYTGKKEKKKKGCLLFYTRANNCSAQLRNQKLQLCGLQVFKASSLSSQASPRRAVSLLEAPLTPSGNVTFLKLNPRWNEWPGRRENKHVLSTEKNFQEVELQGAFPSSKILIVQRSISCLAFRCPTNTGSWQQVHSDYCYQNVRETID